MEPPFKRFRVGFSSEYEDNSDLERDRCRNDMRLKNAFEVIFEKYSKDFADTGDEVDLETGEIVVDNGHLSRMRDEQDTGQGDVGHFLRSFAEDLETEEELEVENTSTVDEDESGTNDELSGRASTDDELEKVRYEGEADQGDVVVLPVARGDMNAEILAILQSNIANQNPWPGGLARTPARTHAFPQSQMNAAALQQFGQSIASQVVQFMVGTQQPLPPVSPIPPLFGLTSQPHSVRPSPHSRDIHHERRPRCSLSRRSIWALSDPSASVRRKRKIAESAIPRAVFGAINPQSTGALTTNKAADISVEARRPTAASLNPPTAGADVNADMEANEPHAGYSANIKRPRLSASWASEDDQLLIELFEGRRLPAEEIARYFPGRTSVSVKSRYYKFLREPGPRRWYSREAPSAKGASPGTPSSEETSLVAPQPREASPLPDSRDATETPRPVDGRDTRYFPDKPAPEDSRHKGATSEMRTGNLIIDPVRRTSRPARINAGRRSMDQGYLNTVEVVPEGYSSDIDAGTEEVEDAQWVEVVDDVNNLGESRWADKAEETDGFETIECDEHVEERQHTEQHQDVEEAGTTEKEVVNNKMPTVSPTWDGVVDGAKVSLTPAEQEFIPADQLLSPLISAGGTVSLNEMEVARVTSTKRRGLNNEAASPRSKSSKTSFSKLSGLPLKDSDTVYTTPKAPKSAGKAATSSILESSSKKNTKMLSNFVSPVLVKREVLNQALDSEDELAM